jgi:hypothetical protein
MRDPFKPYKKWRRKTAKHFNCTEEAVENAIEEGKQILTRMRASDNEGVRAFVDIYRTAWMPAYQAFFMVWLYNQNPTLNLLLNAAAKMKPGESPYTQPVQ